MLKRNSKSEEVKKMQSILRKEGFFTHKSDTGFFGPETERALKEYQRARGIKVDGIYGERSKDMLESEDHAKTLLTSPHVQGTPLHGILKDMYSKGDHAINLGKGRQFVTPDDVKNYHKNLENNLSRHYPKN